MYLSKKALVGLTLLIAVAFAGFWYVSKSQINDQGPVASNDIPVVVRTNGGLLEVATIHHRRAFDLTKAFTILGYQVPFCKETATYTVDAAITYRIRLAKRWVGDYTGGTLYLSVPPPEPSLPVAFDTSRLRATLDGCRLAPSLNTKDELLRSISSKLATDAKQAGYMRLARGDEARATVEEFARKWLIGQNSYNLPSSTPIEVSFNDE